MGVEGALFTDMYVVPIVYKIAQQQSLVLQNGLDYNALSVVFDISIYRSMLMILRRNKLNSAHTSCQ